MSKFLDEEIKDMQLQLDDRDGQLLHLQREEGAVQASVAMTLPGYHCRMGFALVMVPLPVRGKTVAIVMLKRG